MVTGNLEVEVALLGRLIEDPECVRQVVDILGPEVFQREIHSQVYESILSLYKDDLAIDYISVSRRYDEIGGRQFVGHRSAIAALLTMAHPTSVNVRFLALSLIEDYKRRQAVKIHTQAIDWLSDPTRSFSAVMAQTGEQLFALGAHSDETATGIVPICREALPEALRWIERARTGEGSMGVVPYPWPTVARLSPLRPGEATVVCGRPGNAKTAYALNVALWAAKKGIPVGIFSLEMNKKSLMLRLISMSTGIESGKIERGETSDEEHGRIVEVVPSLGKLPIHIDDDPDLSEQEFILKARIAHKAHGLGLIIIDYLQLMGRKYKDNEAASVGSSARTIRKTARILNIPIIVICQVNRQVEFRPDKRPLLSDLRESGEIEQEADIVLALYRDDYYEPDPDKHTGLCEVIVRKHRNGGLGTAHLYFKAATTVFVTMPTLPYLREEYA